MISHEVSLPVDEILEAVERFARERVAPMAVRHEQPMTADTVAQLNEEVVQLGLLPLEDCGGTGLWEDSASPTARRLGLSILQPLSRASTGFAWQLQERALALWLARRLDLDGTGLVVVTQGRYGLARHALARYLFGTPLRAEDEAMLDDCFGTATGTRLLVAADPWWRVLMPVWRKGLGMQWVCFAREAVESGRHEHLHGLDELLGIALMPQSAIEAELPSPIQDTRSLMSGVLVLQAAGQLALAHGALRRALEIASEYAGQRRQGGVRIDEHPAVQALLTDARSVLADTEVWLSRLAALEPEAPPSLNEAFLARASLHPRICGAANACMQVLGGTGYMRDCGVEKIVRDCNVLRLLHGTPVELHMFASVFSVNEASAV
ncbi:acyl-CoA dehydrogenase [Algiphilus aromaticivorans]|uniref:acyl-CoA dehydrogenase n=1 Tax=Algiphilus aromaticivorans TaxID=382454 RepID=UPI0005C1A152|nr:acyl-CoA dehydrogenase [Algiphilus aromaticivorans]